MRTITLPTVLLVGHHYTQQIVKFRNYSSAQNQLNSSILLIKKLDLKSNLASAFWQTITMFVLEVKSLELLRQSLKIESELTNFDCFQVYQVGQFFVVMTIHSSHSPFIDSHTENERHKINIEAKRRFALLSIPNMAKKLKIKIIASTEVSNFFSRIIFNLRRTRPKSQSPAKNICKHNSSSE